MSLDESLTVYEEGVRLIKLCTERLNEAQKKIEILVKEEKIPEMYLNSSYMILVLKHPTENIDPIAIEYTDGYCERKCVLSASQHCYEPHFEPLAKVCKHLGKKFHCHDGGSPELFLEWLEENGYDGVEYEES